MQNNFWDSKGQILTVLAPMEDVTDTVFRQMIKRIAPADVMLTEFTNVEGVVYALAHSNAEQSPVLRRLRLTKSEHPVVAQLWGKEPENFLKSAKYAIKTGFDGVDINFGCPQRDVMKIGGGAAVIAEKPDSRVKEIIQAVKEGAGDSPVSIKTRLGKRKLITQEWIGYLLQQKPDALTVHLRTAAELSMGSAHWEEMKKIVDIRRTMKNKTVLIGNGDIRDTPDGEEKCREYSCDGFMIGRGVLSNPAAFDRRGGLFSKKDRLEYLKQHLNLWEETWGSQKDFQILKKFIKAYINGFPMAAEMRGELMEAISLNELKNLVTRKLDDKINK